jgi:hypothetical protein
MLDRWNAIGNTLIPMARDFPKTNTILGCRKTSAPLRRILSTPPHWILSSYAGFPDHLGPDFGQGDNPSRDVFKTKADEVKFV